MSLKYVDYISQDLNRYWCEVKPVALAGGEASYFCTAGHVDGETVLRFDAEGQLRAYLQGKDVDWSSFDPAGMTALCDR